MCLWEMGADALPIDKRTPLVFIHGINLAGMPAPPQYGTFDNLAAAVASSQTLSPRFKPYFVSYYSNDVSVLSLASRLRDLLDAASLSSPTLGSRPIVIVAHSMGGLISRAFMLDTQEQGAFATAAGGNRVIRVFTLGTPHHGTPIANGPSRDSYQSGSWWLADLALFDNEFYAGPTNTVTWPLVNRSDLRWDNYDSLFTNYSSEPDSDYWLGTLNGDTSFDSKLVAYSGTYPVPSSIGDCGATLKFCVGSFILDQFTLASDGVVPVKSANFYNADMSIRQGVLPRFVDGYSHTDLATGLPNDNMLFPMLLADLDKLAPTIVWAKSPPAVVTGGQSYSVAWQIAGGTKVTHTNVLWDPTAAWKCTASAVPACSTLSTVSPVSPGVPGVFVATFVAPSVTAGTNYSVAAHAVVDDHETWSPFLSILVTPASSPPPAPVLIAPGLGSYPGTTTSTLTPTFSWEGVPGADNYQLELSDSSGVLSVVSVPASQTTVVQQSALEDNHAYTWRMRSHGSAGWGGYSAYYYFATFTGLAADFALSAAPSSAVISAGGSAAVIINTATVRGSPQTLTFGVGSLPAGVSATTSVGSVQSGGSMTLTLNVGSGTTPGAYTIAVAAANNVGVSHATTIGLTVNPVPAPGVPSVCLTPPSLGFSDQQVGTLSATQLVSLKNCGDGPLHISSIGASPEFFIGPGSIVPPIDLAAGGTTTFQVGFAPAASGLRTGGVKVFSNAPGSPTFMALSGNATAAPPTTGTVSVQATLNGQPFSGDMTFSVTGPGGTIDFGNAPLNWPNQGAGSYSVGFIGSPPGGGTLNSITPSSTQTLTAGNAVVFTFNFTAPNEFAFSCPTSSLTGTTALMIAPVGGSANVPLTASYVRGGTQTISLAVAGLPAGATASFNPQPLALSGVNATSTATVTTGVATPPGLYQLTFSATNQDGTTHTLTGILVVLAGSNLSLVSTAVAPSQPDGLSDFPGVSADGRYIVFFSVATDLVPGDTNGIGDVFVRDQQTGVTSRVSVASDGSQGDDWSGQPSMSADGRFVAFRSNAGNLIAGGRKGFGDILIRDQQLGLVTRASVASDGTPADGGSFTPSISGDGRFVVFASNSTNLVAGGGGGVTQIYLRDLQAGQTSVVSLAQDGSLGNAASTRPTISADGRHVAFVSAASNLLPSTTGPSPQVFIRDLQAGTTLLVGRAPDGSPPNALAYVDSEERIAVSSDGRYVAFTSFATNLAPGDNNGAPDVFVWDGVAGTTAVASVTNDGAYLYSGGAAPAISADGRFVAFRLSLGGATAPQIAVRDMAAMQTIIYSTGPGNVLGSAFSASTAMSSGGRTLAFASNASNLVAGGTNGQQDIFGTVLPVSGSAFALTLSVTPTTMAGGGEAIGTVTLSGAAPPAGATVSLYSPNPEVQLPAVLVVPAGGTSASFPVATMAVPGERRVSITAAYGGGSPWALLTLESAGPAQIQPVQGDGQVVASGSPLPIPLSARVLDAVNNPVGNVTVQFSVPTSGPSAVFAGGATSVFVVTNSSGVATAPGLTANAFQGQYAVVAVAPGISAPAVFNITNSGLSFYTLVPCRVIDTRAAIGALGGPALQPSSVRDFSLTGSCGIPAGAKALSVNVTVVPGAPQGYLRLYPGDLAVVPFVSTINWFAGHTRANNAIVAVAGDGSGTIAVRADSTGSVHFILDVNGYFE